MIINNIVRIPSVLSRYVLTHSEGVAVEAVGRIPGLLGRFPGLLGCIAEKEMTSSCREPYGGFRSNPFASCVKREDVPAEVVAKEKEILMAQIQGDEKLKNKPEQVIAKMVEGKIGKYYKENCLLEQAFVKDGNVSVSQYAANTAKALGGKIEVVSFVRFEKGEGLEKREENFAEEIAKQLAQ